MSRRHHCVGWLNFASAATGVAVAGADVVAKGDGGATAQVVVGVAGQAGAVDLFDGGGAVQGVESGGGQPRAVKNATQPDNISFFGKTAYRCLIADKEIGF